MRTRTIVFCLLVLAAGTLAASAREWWLQPFEGQQGLVLQVNPGASLASVALELENAGALRYGQLWRFMARFMGQDGQIKQGEYLITANQSPRNILERLVSGEVVQYAITLPEGITLAQAINLIQAEPRLTRELNGPRDQRLLDLVSPQTSAEGMFFPDTYQFSRGDSDLSLLRRAHQRMQAAVNEVWAARAESSILESPYQAVILASIVEKETGLGSERPTIAGVFTRRLQAGMRLQTDPTVIYGLGAGFDGNLRRSHLADADNPYNSYRHHGLPPTPIALVGRAALEAAVNPEAGTSFYFVARGDGSHQFSDTLEEHQQAVRRYQLKCREDYRSSPPAGAH